MLHDNRGLLQGTLELLVLRALSLNEAHGYGLARWIEHATDDALRIEEGSLYPALHRMADKSWIASEWGVSENNRRAKFYGLTDKGRKTLEARTADWHQTVEVVAMALATEVGPGSLGS